MQVRNSIIERALVHS